jgi:glycerophosphoryl diester phosphodiesterase
LIFSTDTSSIIQHFHNIRQNGSRVWANSLWAGLCAGHDDDIAIEEGKPEASWGWLLEKGINIVQTDRLVNMLQYLKDKGMRN